MTEAEYLEFERQSELKHEFLGGEIFAMTGASRAHNLISVSTSVTLYNQLRSRDCEVYPGDMRVKIQATGLYTYPDISVICGSPELNDDRLDTLLNPTVIIEVLSPSTERYDRGRKFQHYRELKSLQEYVLIAQDSPRIERYLRQDDGWQFTDVKGLDSQLELTSIGCTLKLTDVYEKVRFGDDSTNESAHGDRSS
jgi:Uma2 family endonuclease